MADTSLDDFFAKKDKSKKSKSKGKYTTSEQITKKFEKSQRKFSPNETSSTSNNPQSSINSSNISSGVEEEEEWNEVEVEKEKDYSGLRIQALSLADKEKEEELMKEQQPQENGEDSKVIEMNAGPWKLPSAGAAVITTTDIEFEEKDEEAQEAELVERVAAMPSTYIPPHMRQSASAPSKSGTGGSGGGSNRRHGKNVPEIDSELHFPSLSQAVEVPQGNPPGEKTFQSVKHGSRSKDDSLHQGVHLDLGNKYSALGFN